jgi:intein/homing endonuclease
MLFRECYAMEKIHGCLESDTLIETKDGPKTIKEICDSKYVGKILSFDIKNNRLVWKKIRNHSVGEETKDWHEIQTENGIKIRVTGNHMFWLPKLQCWRRADKLQDGDLVIIFAKSRKK